MIVINVCNGNKVAVLIRHNVSHLNFCVMLVLRHLIFAFFLNREINLSRKFHAIRVIVRFRLLVACEHSCPSLPARRGPGAKEDGCVRRLVYWSRGVAVSNRAITGVAA